MKLCKLHLSNRLLAEKSEDSNTEEYMIQLIKETQGVEEVKEIEGMIKDINLSKED